MDKDLEELSITTDEEQTLNSELGAKIAPDPHNPWPERYSQAKNLLPLMNLFILVPAILGFPTLVVPLSLYLMQRWAFGKVKKLEGALAFHGSPEYEEYRDAALALLTLYFFIILFGVILLGGGVLVLSRRFMV